MAAAKLSVKVAELEKQLVALTSEVDRLKKKIATSNDDLPWWEKRWGLFDGDPDYDKAMELGRQYRESLRPKARKKSKKTAKKTLAVKATKQPRK
jgi:hypothetical protein